MYEQSFLQECIRKELLLKSFEDIEKKERDRKRSSDQLKKYDRIFRGIARVVKFDNSTLCLVSEAGEPIEPVRINSEIAQRIRCGDDLMLIAGKRNSSWHVIFVQMIGSTLSPDSVPDVLN